MWKIRAIFLILLSRGFYVVTDAGTASRFKNTEDTWAAVISSAEAFLEWAEHMEAECQDNEV